MGPTSEGEGKGTNDERGGRKAEEKVLVGRDLAPEKNFLRRHCSQYYTVSRKKVAHYIQHHKFDKF